MFSDEANFVYPALDEHQRRLNPALFTDLQERHLAERFATWIKELHRWKDIFVSEFKIELPHVAFCIKSTWSNCYGYFRPGLNEFGLTREIAINRLYLEQREKWQVIGTLLHELLHAWQDAFGKPGKRNYHNNEFRKKAEFYGLIIDSTGVTEYAPKSLFMDLLQQYGIQVPELQGHVRVPPVHGKSTLNKWICACTPPVALRVGRSEIRVQCLDCGTQFIRQE